MIEESAIPIDTATDMVSVGNNVGHAVSNEPSTSTNRTRQRLLHFSVHYQDRIVQLEIADTGTIGELKLMLHGHTGVPACQQILNGWARTPPSETVTLKSLSLPRENILFMCTMNAADGVPADDE